MEIETDQILSLTDITIITPIEIIQILLQNLNVFDIPVDSQEVQINVLINTSLVMLVDED